jgi:aspartate/methionine/tyrosine aminotransferase
MSKRADINPFIVMDVLARAAAREAEGHSIIHMEIGQPSTPVPPNVVAAVEAAVRAGRVAYTQSLGLPDLRSAIARHYERAYGFSVDPERVGVTTASSAAFNFAFLACFDAGARIGMVRPYYPAYPNILKTLGLETVLIECDEAYRPDLARIEAAMKAGLDGLLIASPANPTGAVIANETLASIAALAREYNVRIISDEIYHGITYDAPAASILPHDPSAIIINSFSKFFCMAGWRVGWMVMPEDLVRTMECLAQNLMISPPTLSQIGALAAFEPEALSYYDGIVDGYARSRTLVTEQLPKLGFSHLSPADGAFYAYGDCSAFGMSSDELCRRLMVEAGIAVTPGGDFDDRDGAHTVRFSYAGAESDIAEGMRRLDSWATSQKDQVAV